MNSYDRFTKRLQGESVDRPPNFDIMMTFAAHYIGQPLSRYYADYRDEINEWSHRVDEEAAAAEAAWRREQELLRA